jgi:hypothetical protein
VTPPDHHQEEDPTTDQYWQTHEQASSQPAAAHRLRVSPACHDAMVACFDSAGALIVSDDVDGHHGSSARARRSCSAVMRALNTLKNIIKCAAAGGTSGGDDDLLTSRVLAESLLRLCGHCARIHEPVAPHLLSAALLVTGKLTRRHLFRASKIYEDAFLANLRTFLHHARDDAFQVQMNALRVGVVLALYCDMRSELRDG